MTGIAYIDVIGGAAGDMLLAALIDAGAPLDDVRGAIEAVLPGRFAIDTEIVRRGGIRARLLRIAPDPSDDPGVQPRTLRELLSRLEGAGLPDPVARRARSMLERIGEAEARVHGVIEDDVELHEMGDDDSLLDVVGVSAAVHGLGVERLLVSSVPLEAGGGMLPARAGHPAVPLPAPVTVELLRGFHARAGGPGEVVTPTAAAVFAALGHPSVSFPEMTIDSVGYGAGSRDPSDRPNIVRVFVGTSETAASVRQLLVMEANLDDMTPELVADAAQALFAAGALDVWTTPIQMKKGRQGVLLSALAGLDAEPRLQDAFFEATSTFGVRSYRVSRAELERRVVTVELADGSVRVKVGHLKGRVMTATPEHDDVAALAARVGRPVREIYDEAVGAARALRHSPSVP